MEPGQITGFTDAALPDYAAAWVENASGYAASFRTREEAAAAAAKWNAHAKGREWYSVFNRAATNVADGHTIRLYEDGGGGLFLHRTVDGQPDTTVYTGLELVVPGQFAQDARALIEGDGDDWTVERLEYAEVVLDGLALIATYARDKQRDVLTIQRNPGTGDFQAGGAGRRYLGLESWE